MDSYLFLDVMHSRPFNVDYLLRLSVSCLSAITARATYALKNSILMTPKYVLCMYLFEVKDRSSGVVHAFRAHLKAASVN